MLKSHVAAALLALGSLAALPACSSMGSSQSSSAAPMARPELSPAMVMQVQTTLQQDGVYKGKIDGLWGPETQGAVHSYQMSHGLTANGELDSATLASLNAPSTPAPAATTSAAAPAAPMPAPMPAPAAPAATVAAAPAPAVPGPPMAGTPQPQ